MPRGSRLPFCTPGITMGSGARDKAWRPGRRWGPMEAPHTAAGWIAKDGGNNRLCFIYPPKTPPTRGGDFARLQHNNEHATFG